MRKTAHKELASERHTIRVIAYYSQNIYSCNSGHSKIGVVTTAGGGGDQDRQD